MPKSTTTHDTPSIPTTIFEVLKSADAASTALMNTHGLCLSYENLLKGIRGLRNMLLDEGIRPGDRVAYAMQQGCAAAWTFLGIISFTTVVPLNPNLGREEMDFFLKDADVTVLLTDEAVSRRMGSLTSNMTCPSIQLPEPVVIEAYDRFTQPNATPELSDVAMILHTSGTTSSPKRVELSHSHVLASCRNVARPIALQRDDCCLNPMPLFHSHGLVAGLLAPLLAASRVIVTDAFEAVPFLDAVVGLRPTWYTAVPTIHQAIAQALQDYPERMHCHALRVIRSASAPLSPKLMKRLEGYFGVPVIETYGMTEATNQITGNPLPPATRKPGSVGRAVGLRLKVVDAKGTEQPTGVRGEVWIQGESVAPEYKGNPQATRESFEAGWFKTGDLGYLDSDGYLYLTGRSREIINRGGELIEPRVVDEALLAHPAVEEALAFAIPHPTLGEELAAAIVCRADGEVSEQELRGFLYGRIADHMIPVRIVTVKQLPKNDIGKPKRTALAGQLGSFLSEEYAPPQSPFEIELAKIWSTLLGIEKVGRNDNFFLLGGDSLAASRALLRVEGTIGNGLTLRDTFRYPVLKDLAWLLFQRTLPPADRQSNEVSTSSSAGLT